MNCYTNRHYDGAGVIDYTKFWLFSSVADPGFLKKGGPGNGKVTLGLLRLNINV